VPHELFPNPEELKLLHKKFKTAEKRLIASLFTFSRRICDKIADRKMTRKEFCDLTLVSISTWKLLRSNAIDEPNLWTVMKIDIWLNLSAAEALENIRAAGLILLDIEKLNSFLYMLTCTEKHSMYQFLAIMQDFGYSPDK
jgi:hypothetical protein